MNEQVIAKIIENGVKNLKEFGYPNVTKENILTDFVYRQFFESMLNSSLGQGFDVEINHLKNEVAKASK